MKRQYARLASLWGAALVLAGCQTVTPPVVVPPDCPREGPGLQRFFESSHPITPYEANPNHLQVGFRWQPMPNRPTNSVHDIALELGSVGSYASFWFMGLHTHPTPENLDYDKAPSSEVLAIRHAIQLCKERGIKTELVLWQIPLWMNGGETYEDFNQPPESPQQIYDMVKRTVEWFGEVVDYYGIYHEANHPGYWDDSGDKLIEYYMLPAIRAIRDYGDATGDRKVISTAGLSPSRNLKRWYRIQVKHPELMELIDNFSLNLSDYRNGKGGGGFTGVRSCWSQLDYMRRVLDEAGYPDKGLAAAESWVSWDGDQTANGPEASGGPVEATLRILGETLQRGLSTANLPWKDNNSDWSMGLTKRLDYNGALAELGEELYTNALGGAAIATRKLNLQGSDENLWIDNDAEWFDNAAFASPYAVPNDPNHTHYYIWRWFAQLSAGAHECVHHAMAGEPKNDIAVPGWDPEKLIRISSYDLTAKRFIVLVAQHEQNPEPTPMTIKIPARIRKGAHYHRDGRLVGQGMADGQAYRVCWTSENVDSRTGYHRDKISGKSGGHRVTNGTLTATIPASRRLTTIVFERE